MFFKITRVIFALISTAFMLRFAIPKLLAMPVSVKSFTMFSQVLPFNAKYFMYFTGVVELLIALVLFASLFIKKAELKNKLQIFGYVLLLCTMIGAILSELFLRPAPIPSLIIIALVLTAISFSELSILAQRKAK